MNAMAEWRETRAVLKHESAQLEEEARRRKQKENKKKKELA
jgi:hypothetical protein